MTRRRTPISTDQAPAAIGPYSQAIEHEGVLYCSGQVPLDTGGEIAGETPAEQAAQCLRNLSAVAEAGGTSLDQALRLTIYTTRLEDFAAINEAYAAFFGDEPPARAAVGVAALPKGALVEIDAIVAIPGVMAATALDLSEPAVSDARPEARRFARETPVFEAGWLSRSLGGSISVKAENLQRTGSFKVRGVAVKLARDPVDPEAGVVTASAGNHGQALAYVASELGLACRIFVPSTSSVSKAQAIESRGAELEFAGDSIEPCLEAARAFAAERGATFVHPFDDPAVILGQATLGLELAEQVPDLAKVVVPIGGGGLVAGIAGLLKAVKPDVEVAGVQAEVCAPVSGHPPESADVRFALADGIAVKEPGELTRPLIERHVDELCTVSEDAIAETMVELIQRSKLVVEGAGAVSVAALRTGAVEPAPGGTTVALLSGGNLDLSRVSAIARLHEAVTGRRVQIATRVPDHPGGLAALLARIATEGGNVIDVQHVRDIGRRGFHETRVEMGLEVRGAEHRDRILAALEAGGYRVRVIEPGDPPNGGVEG